MKNVTESIYGRMSHRRETTMEVRQISQHMRNRVNMTIAGKVRMVVTNKLYRDLSNKLPRR